VSEFEIKQSKPVRSGLRRTQLVWR
jgi:hypothetical protein